MKEPDADTLLRAAIMAQRGGRAGEARGLLDQALTLSPNHPGALNSLGMIALGAGEHRAAADLFTRAAVADPRAAELQVNVAKAHRLSGDDAGERSALEAALAIDQRHFVSLLRLAELHERRGEHAASIERWSAVLTLIGMADPRAPELDDIARRGNAYLAQQRTALADALDHGLADVRAAASSATRRRFEACMDTILGKRRIFVNECAGLHYPFLPADEFFAREHFPWLPRFEAHTDAIRQELEDLLSSDGEAVKPYVAMEPGTPDNKWSELDHSLAWGAIHLWRHGVANEAILRRCPNTAAAFADVPLADVPGRMPTVFFSMLQPHTHLPAHSGVSNTRAIIHLPLIVPDKCRFRVGGETRAWTVGEALAFDDTIEHEAWNDSDELRAVLIFDVWNPHLAHEERDLLRTFFEVADVTGNTTRVRVSD